MQPQPVGAEDDVVLAATPRAVRAAGGALLAAGVFGILHVVQLYGVITAIRGPFAAAPPVMAVEALAAVVAGLGLSRARAWAAVSAIAAAALLGTTTGAWFVFAIANGVVTFFGMLVPWLSLLSLVLAIVAKGPCERTAAARKRLEGAGLELGV